jgi:hypothetical protein
LCKTGAALDFDASAATAASTLTASENVVSVLVSKSNDGGGSIAELLEITLSCGRLDGVDCYVFIIEFMLHLW